MKAKTLWLTLTLLLSCGWLMAQEKTAEIKVYGNCGMCKKRIEKAATIEGVSKASWDKETKILTLTYDAAKVNTDSVQKKVAAVGHDTEKYEADDKVYQSLHECCLYDRKKKSKS